VVAYQDREFSISSLPLFATEKQVIGCRGCNRKELTEVVELVGRGRLTSVVGATWPLNDFQQAVIALEEGAVAGRIVITR
jgi:D-arabinose 1-dehydrogenase-like Zn-dependent alcohol dehydrogenase